MKAKLTLENAYLRGKRVLLRVDWNVPLTGGAVGSDARIRATLPTLKFLVSAPSAVVVLAHLGRPKGQRVDALSLAPVVERLKELLPDTPIRFCPEIRGMKVFEALASLSPGEVLVLENVRFEPGEKTNDGGFASELATYADIFVNDAFGVCHRAHASVVGAAEHLTGCAGLLLQRELEALAPLLAITRDSSAPPRPFALLMGGAKVKDKVGAIEALIPKLDHLLIGGAMAYTFLKAKGEAIGSSRCEDDKLDLARELIALAEASGTTLSLPVDHLVAPSIEPFEGEGPGFQLVKTIPDGQMGLDIGPETATKFRQVLQKANTIVWNGPVGLYEDSRFEGGTRMMAQSLGLFAAKKGKTVVTGGGETVEAAERFGVASMFTHLSTGGGAFLALLEGKELPGIAALRDAEV